ncbi:MAG: LuxR C-terminal-related transcriptional regulator [Bacteroidales bacterium]|jgi:DNA-binding CsgD family transcriptional regulator|nr:LuxR C-terminal-related transcriptional regulator [Bacteroidales bacterium]
MQNDIQNIFIIESSDILFEGICRIMLREKGQLRIVRYKDLDNFSLCGKQEQGLIIANLSLVQNRIKNLRSLRKIYSTSRWIGLASALASQELINEFDETVRIDSSEEELLSKTIRKAVSGNTGDSKTLSERETEVLKCLSGGLSNKEIAEALNISIHTVISHRKNISQKTGIRSQSGLVIYAISRNIVSIGKKS